MFEPKFETKLHASATAKYIGAKDDDSLAELIRFFRRERWRGNLVMNWTGNGGVSDVVFTETKPASEMTEQKS